jgi:hypothetical protein
MYAMSSSETSVSTYKTTLRYNQEEQYRHAHRHNNMKSHNMTVVYRIFLSPSRKKCWWIILKQGTTFFQIMSNS